MVPLSTIIANVRLRYEAVSGGSLVRWSDADITEFVNQGLETLAEATGFYERYASVPVQLDRTFYDVRGFTPETVIQVTSIWSTLRNQWLEPIDPNQLDIWWEKARGTPLSFFTRGIYWFGVYPASDTDGSNTLQVHFKAIPSRFTHTQAVLGDLPDDHTTALEDYALYEMACVDRQPKRAIQLFESYQRREKALLDFTDNRLVSASAGRMGKFAGRMGRRFV
jgi:hypothetical protein